MTAMRIDDPLEAFQVHGCCGFMGCILLAFFKIDKGIVYGGKSLDSDLEVKQLGGWELLGVQFLGCISILFFSGAFSAIFFFISKKKGCLRLKQSEELFGGDLYYFGPIKFDELPDNIDRTSNMKRLVRELLESSEILGDINELQDDSLNIVIDDV
jgi:ammonia channel protein AmtB